MSIESQYKDFIERNGGKSVFRWIIEQDGFVNPSKAKLYPIIAWNEYYHKEVVVIGSAYRYDNYFVVINYEDDLSQYPTKLADWIDEAMNIAELDNIVEVFRDNHLIAIYDENMKMMGEWYAEDLGMSSINYASYKNNIIFDDEIIMSKDVVKSDITSKDDFLDNINNLLKEFINNSTKNTPINSSDIFKEKNFFNPLYNNRNYNSRIFDKETQHKTTIKVNSDEFDDDFKQKWA